MTDNKPTIQGQRTEKNDMLSIAYYHLDPKAIYGKFSFSRLCADAGVREDFSEPGETILTNAFCKLVAVDSRRWIRFILNVLSELSKETIAALSDMEMRIHLEAMEETKLRNLVKLGVPEYYAHMAANSRRGYWFTANTGAVTRRITNERLTRAGFFELSPAYESIQSACIGRAVYRTVRMVW